jgi:hypothetical protein
MDEAIPAEALAKSGVTKLVNFAQEELPRRAGRESIRIKPPIRPSRHIRPDSGTSIKI